MTMERFKRAWHWYWESITWANAIVAAALTVVALFFGWYLILNFPAYAEQQGIMIERSRMVVGIIGMVVITLVGAYWCISMCAAAHYNSTRRR